jgi:lipopolysaccharide export system ATP-binding protein
MMYVLETKNLVKSYKNRRVVDNVNIKVGKGEIVGLLGPNGAGKTTTFHMIVGLLKADQGRVVYNKKDITSFPMYKRARVGISYLSQEPSIFRNLTVKDNILAILEMMKLSDLQRMHRAEKLMKDLRIAYLSEHMAYTLSGGERRRLEIARALACRPSFLMLDEPFSGVDPIAVAEVQQIITDLRDQGLSILLTDHNVRETLAITNRSYILYQGKVLVSGTPEELVNDNCARRFYLGETFSI